MEPEIFDNLVWRASLDATDKFIESCKGDQTYWILHRAELSEIIHMICRDQIYNAIKEGKKNPKFFDEFLELIECIRKYGNESKHVFKIKIEGLINGLCTVTKD